MQESHFRIILGISLIIALYFSLDLMMLAIIALMIFEAITNYRVPRLVNTLSKRYQQTPDDRQYNNGKNSDSHFNFEAERMLRVVLVLIIAPSYFMYFEYSWFLSWFVAFALIGAGLSGLCPMVAFLKLLGFR